MTSIKNEKLAATLTKEFAEYDAYNERRKKEAQENIVKLESAAERLDRAGIAWGACANALFVDMDFDQRNKAYFSERVKVVAEALGCPPDIYVGEGTYRATFLDGKVWVSIYNPLDCQLIETEETIVRKVLKPHPACVAALAELEEVV